MKQSHRMTNDDIALIDRSNYRHHLVEFPQQVMDAMRIARNTRLNFDGGGIGNVVVTGLGGSAIAGDLLRSYLADRVRVPMFVNRDYRLPGFVQKQSLVIVSSYSGDTEETLAAYREAVKRKSRIICISSGGELTSLARRHRNSLIAVPRGLPPRAALGYLFFPVLSAVTKLRLATENRPGWRETTHLLGVLAKRFGNADARRNLAAELAYRLKGKLPIIYSSTERFDSVNLRWRGQLAENAKVLAFGNVVPEMNHNELVGWRVLKDLMKNMTVVILRDASDHRRVQKRMDIMKSIVGEFSGDVLEVRSEGRSLLARMFSLIHLGDWVSFYLAILNGVDPTPVKVIDYLKTQLAKV